MHIQATPAGLMASSRKRHYTMAALFRYRLSSIAQPVNIHAKQYHNALSDCLAGKEHLTQLQYASSIVATTIASCTFFLRRRRGHFLIKFPSFSYRPTAAGRYVLPTITAATLISLCKPIFPSTPSIRNRHIAFFYSIPASSALPFSAFLSFQESGRNKFTFFSF